MATNGLMGSGALDKIRAWHEAALDQVSYPMIVIGALLAHLDALAAPADGEALGRELFMLRHEGAGETVWRYYEAESKAPWIAAALRLHAIGHAAGALSREGEIAALREECSGVRVAVFDRDDTIHRLTAERDALQRHYDAAGPEHNLPALLDLYHARMAEARTESESLSAQLAESDLLMGKAIDAAAADRERALDAEAKLATARDEGARVEREACERDIVDVCRLDYPTGGSVENVVAMVLGKALARIEKRHSARGDR